MGEFFAEFVTWYNVLFSAPLVFVFLFAILQLIGVGFELGGSEPDVDVDVDVDVEPDIDLDVDADVDVDVDADAEADVGGPGLIASTLGFLNVGKVPCMVILMTLFASWGIVGLICNSIIPVKEVHFLISISLGAAFILSILSTRYIAAGIARIFPESDRPTSYSSLIGHSARITSGRVTSTFGRAIVQAPDGSRLNISCRVKEGAEELVQEDEVLLMNYDRDTRTFEVAKSDIAFL